MHSQSRPKEEAPDFTSSKYQLICERYLKHADCRLFTEKLRAGTILVRHDVDHSLNRAKALGHIESIYGIRSTFFVDPLSPYYSIFEPAQREILGEVIGMGHSIGLHFDASRHNPSTVLDLEEAVSFEAKILETAGAKPTAISFHNPRPSDLELEQNLISGLVNAYSKPLFKDIAYVSDSNGIWKFDTLESSLEAHSKSPYALQILIHPEWWQDSELPPRSRLYRSMAGRLSSQMRTYDKMLDAAGRPNLTGMPKALESLVLGDFEASRELDFLWNMGMHDELSYFLQDILNERLVESLRTKAILEWGIPREAVESFLAREGQRLNPVKILQMFDTSYDVDERKRDAYQILKALPSKSSPQGTWRRKTSDPLEEIDLLSKALAIFDRYQKIEYKEGLSSGPPIPTPDKTNTRDANAKGSDYWEKFKAESLTGSPREL